MMVPLLFTVNIYHDGLLHVNLLELVLVSPTSMYYKIPSDSLAALKLLKNNKGLCEFVKASYENNLNIDLFTEQNGYDIMKMIDEELHFKKHVRHVGSNSDVKTNQPLDDVAYVVEQFEHENEGNVNIHRMTTDDLWLNKLVGNGTFIGHTDIQNPNLQGRFLLEVEDPGDEQVKSKLKAKHDMSHLSFNLDTPWNQCKLVLGMRNPQKVDDDECETSKQGSKKGDGRKAVNETLSKVVKERWDKKKEYEKRVSKQGNCPFRDDLNLGDGGGISITSNGHKGLLQAIADWLPNAEHIQYARHIYVNFKKRWSGLHFKRLFWGAAATTICSAAFENGILENLNSRIVGARGKPIITMLEDIRVYIMQKMFCMNKQAFDNKDSITPSVRRHMEYNKRIKSLSVLIKPVYGPKFWKPTSQPPPLPPVERKMFGRPRKRRIRHPTKDDDHVVTRVGRVMHYHKCWEIGHNKTKCPYQERPKLTYLRSKGIVIQEAPSSSIPYPTATPSTSNTMPPSPTPSDSNKMPPPLTPSPYIKHYTTLFKHILGKPAKSNASSNRGGSMGGATGRGGSKGGASKRDRGSSKRGRGSNTMSWKGLRDESSDKTVYEMEREQMAIDKEDQFWEECARKFDHVEECKAQDKDEPLQGEADLPTQESIVEANPKHTRSKKSKTAEVPN
ncbi:hypothetical protein Tco_1169712 [Tanacetum coccineum]